MNTKYIWLLIILLGFTACNTEEDVLIDNNALTITEPLPELTAGSADFSNYVALGPSFTAGYTDGALFIAGQENSFPNILSKEFSKLGGGAFTQPLMNDNIGGLLFGGIENPSFSPRYFFNGAGPERLSATPTTETFNILSGPFNNMGVPGAKSFHLLFDGYGDPANLATATANPYFVRMASAPNATVLGDAMSQNPSFFTLTLIGGNDVLGYALSGGDGSDPITDTATFDYSFNTLVTTLTSGGAKGVVTNVPYIINIPHFTTVPYNPLDPTDSSFGPLIPTLNGIFGQLNQVFAYLQSVGAISNAEERSIVFSTTAASAVVIKDETLTDISSQITGVLSASPEFAGLLQSFGLPTDPLTVGTVAALFGASYGQSRQATASDLFVLPSSTVIGTVNTETYAFLTGQGLPADLAGQFSVEGVTNPLADKWVLLPSEQDDIKTATDAYNATIESVAASNGLALVDLKSILSELSTTGVTFGDFTLNADLVTGGAISLDGVHLTARGYSYMAYKYLEAIDTTYGSNFIESGNTPNPGDYPTNYSPSLQ